VIYDWQARKKILENRGTGKADQQVRATIMVRLNCRSAPYSRCATREVELVALQRVAPRPAAQCNRGTPPLPSCGGLGRGVQTARCYLGRWNRSRCDR